MNSPHDCSISNVLACSSHSANMPSAVDEEAGADVDEPPDPSLKKPLDSNFQRTAIRTSVDQQASMLTAALRSQLDEESAEATPRLLDQTRRRSVMSSISLASTIELTSDTGLTSPSRATTPSPPLPAMRHLQLGDEPVMAAKIILGQQGELADAAPKKRCISFACTAKPYANAPGEQQPLTRPARLIKAPSAQAAPRRPCIKFACQAAKPASTQNTPPKQESGSVHGLVKTHLSLRDTPSSPAKKHRSPSSHQSRSPRPVTSRRATNETTVRPKRFLTADSKDLQCDSSRFHEFASDEHHEDEWILEESTPNTQKITIDDTLTKENKIRRIGKEAEEEAEQEEEEEEEEATTMDDEDDVESGEDIDKEEQDDDDISDFSSDDGGDSAGYHTDEETGFAESDEDEDDDLALWVPSRTAVRSSLDDRTPRRASVGEHHSDSSIPSRGSITLEKHRKSHRIPIRPGTPELPDSTDFVCGTLDEDRVMEDAYISCIAARRREKLHLIPQDIDPSFPASEPEEEGEEDRFNPVHHDSDEHVWLHGEMDDLHHEHERHGRRKSKAAHHSPKRYHSPPPKRHLSPPPKLRGRSPRRLFDRHSPRRLRSPGPLAEASPATSPNHVSTAISFGGLGTRVGLTQTKSLPRPPAMFPQAKHTRRGKATVSTGHVRGAIDIVKGLEQKRQRRKEKFYQKYCSRARKGQIPERRTQPGQGAERMRELGLLMAGKVGHGNYVLSI